MRCTPDSRRLPTQIPHWDLRPRHGRPSGVARIASDNRLLAMLVKAGRPITLAELFAPRFVPHAAGESAERLQMGGRVIRDSEGRYSVVVEPTATTTTTTEERRS